MRMQMDSRCRPKIGQAAQDYLPAPSPAKAVPPRGNGALRARAVRYHAAVIALLVVGFCAVALAWGVASFNLLVRDRNRVGQAWSDVDVQLRRRHDLVPQLVEIVKRYASYERALLENLAELRMRGMAERSPGALGSVEASLGRGVERLIAVGEAYPELKASGNFLDLQQRLAETENQIQYARRYYNGAVNNLNTRIDSFPDLLIARLFRFRPAEYFELADVEASAVPEVR
jgi:LemA protein